MEKTGWEVATGEPFGGAPYPLGAFCFYRSRERQGDIAECPTKPGIFTGWKVESGLRYEGAYLVLDYEQVRLRQHLYWNPREVHSREVFPLSPEHLLPLQCAARIALRNTSDPEYVLRQEAFDRSIASGVLPYMTL